MTEGGRLTENPTTRRAMGWRGPLVISVAAILAAIAGGMAVSLILGRPSGQGSATHSAVASANGAAAKTLDPLPVSVGFTVVEVLDPTVAAPATSSDEAIALAREQMANRVGASPRVQLVRLAARDPDSYMDGFFGWIILSTDVPGNPTGPYDPEVEPIIATYTWVYVTADGDVLGASQEMYAVPDAIPSLPAPPSS